MSDEQAVHDWLLKNMPEGASHEAAECALCTDAPKQEENEVADEAKIFSEEQHEQLLASAVERASTTARAEADAEVLSLNEQLAAANATISERDATIAELQARIAQREEDDRLEALADERAQQVQEVANFSDEQVAARKPEWAKMSEETFKTYLDDIREVAKASGKDKTPSSKFDGTRETAGETNSEKSVLTSFFSDASVVEAARV